MPVSKNLLSPFAAVIAQADAMALAVEKAGGLSKPRKNLKQSRQQKKSPSKRNRKKKGEFIPRGENAAKDPGNFLKQMISVHGSVQLSEEVGGTLHGRLRFSEADKNSAYAIACEVSARLDGLREHLFDVFEGRVEVITAVRLSRVIRTAQKSPNNRIACLQAATPFQGFMRMHMSNVRQNMAALLDEITPRLAELSPSAADVVRLDAALTNAMGLKMDGLIEALQERIDRGFLAALKDPIAEVIERSELADERPDATLLFEKNGVLEMHQKLIGQTVRALFLVEEKRFRAFCQAFVAAESIDLAVEKKQKKES